MKRRLRYLAWSVSVLVAVGACWATAWTALAARQSVECSNNLRAIALALSVYSSGCGTFPRGTIPDEDLPPEKRLSWIAELYRNSDYAANNALIVDPAQPWDAEFNLNPRV